MIWIQRPEGEGQTAARETFGSCKVQRQLQRQKASLKPPLISRIKECCSRKLLPRCFSCCCWRLLVLVGRSQCPTIWGAAEASPPGHQQAATNGANVPPRSQRVEMNGGQAPCQKSGGVGRETKPSGGRWKKPGLQCGSHPRRWREAKKRPEGSPKASASRAAAHFGPVYMSEWWWCFKGVFPLASSVPFVYTHTYSKQFPNRSDSDAHTN